MIFRLKRWWLRREMQISQGIIRDLHRDIQKHVDAVREYERQLERLSIEEPRSEIQKITGAPGPFARALRRVRTY